MNKTVELLGDKAEYLLSHTCKTIDKSTLHLPSPHTVEEVWAASDRNIPTLNSLQRLLGHGRLGGTGYVSILPVDQGIEHTAGASFAPNPIYFDPENIVRLAIEGGCNGVASTLGVLGAVARRYAHKIPFVVKINHNELLTYPNSYDQVLFGSVEQAWEMGAVAVGATIYFGSAESRRQLTEIAAAFERAHDLGMATILWCYLRNNAFKKDGVDYHNAADLTGQADHLGATIGADIVKQKLPTCNGGFRAIGFGKTDDKMYTELASGRLPRTDVRRNQRVYQGHRHEQDRAGKRQRPVVRTQIHRRRPNVHVPGLGPARMERQDALPGARNVLLVFNYFADNGKESPRLL